MTETRIERDTMGEVILPAAALYGAQTQRAVENFPISGQSMPAEFIRALGLVKLAAARVNRELGHCRRTSPMPSSTPHAPWPTASWMESSRSTSSRRDPERRRT